MAKPTDEIIKLPDFELQFVQRNSASDNKYDESHISVKQLHEKSSADNKGLIVYFYPRDNTSGCTTQAKDFTEMQDDFSKIGYDIVGISRDSIDSHKKFIDKQDLNIGLLSDPDEALCKHFDVIKEKNMYGKKTMGLVRSTFVFDKSGQLTHLQRNLRAKGYAERLINLLT